MKRKRILVISAIAAGFAVLAGFALQGHHRAGKYELLLENSYTHACFELTSAVSELDAALQKVQYATTPVMLEILCSDIYGKAVAAQMALGELPASAAILEQTSAFLARTGDYACALTKIAAQETLPEDTHAVLQGLAETSALLSAALWNLQSDLSGGSVSIEALIDAETALAQQVNDGDAAPGGTAFQTIEADFPETPSLIYDGPFSEHLGGKAPLALEGLPFTSRDEARAVAAEFLGVRPTLLTYTGESHAVLPTYGFSATVDGGELYIEVTRQGCKVLSLVSSRPIEEMSHSPEQAVEIARSFLTARGFDFMQESYHINHGNILTVNFAPTDNGILCYPDLVKVSVALDTGSIVGFESHGWIMNHTSREYPSPAVDESAARAVVSPELEILSHQLALIPTAGQYEVLCHEFKCRSAQDDNVIVYINASTGNEEKILLLLENENGTLVW